MPIDFIKTDFCYLPPSQLKILDLKYLDDVQSPKY